MKARMTPKQAAVPMPVDDPDAGEQQIRRAHGYGYSDYI
jgi:hypothetical protein